MNPTLTTANAEARALFGPTAYVGNLNRDGAAPLRAVYVPTADPAFDEIKGQGATYADALTDARAKVAASSPAPTAEAPTVYDHVFQTAGLGVAPFSFVNLLSHPTNPQSPAYAEEVRGFYAALSGYGIQSACHCHFCFTCIVHHCIIRDAKGSHFVVGCDCVNKTGDAQLITATEAARREQQRKIAVVKATVKHAARVAAHIAKLDAERTKNDGLTLNDWQEVANRAAWAKYGDVARTVNTWILDGIKTVSPRSEFLTDIIGQLEAGQMFTELSYRQQVVIGQIYAQNISGKNLRSRKTIDAQEVFLTRVDDLKHDVADAAVQTLDTDLKAIREAYWTARKGDGVFVMPESLRGQATRPVEAVSVPDPTPTPEPSSPAPVEDTTGQWWVGASHDDCTLNVIALREHGPAVGVVYPTKYLHGAKNGQPGGFFPDLEGASRFTHDELKLLRFQMPGRTDFTECRVAGRNGWIEALRPAEARYHERQALADAERNENDG